MTTPQISPQARRLYADALLAEHEGMGNLAGSIADGNFENLWITPALAAIQRALDEGADAPAEDSD